MEPLSERDIRFLVRLVVGDKVSVDRWLADPAFSIDEFLRKVPRHLLSCVVLRALESAPWAAQVAPPRMAQLAAARQRHVERSARLLRALGSLADHFSAADLPFFLLKGPYLAQRLYGDPAGREYVDLDLMVAPEDRARAFEVMGQTDFARRSSVLLGDAQTCFFVHAFDFESAEANLDLHWALTPNPAVRIDFQRLWSARRSFPLQGRVYDVLSDADEMLLSCLSLLRDIEHSRGKARSVLDLLVLASRLDATLDWESLFETASREGTVGPIFNTLAFCLDLADAHDLAPRLAATLELRESRRVRAPATDLPMLFRPRPFGLGNRLWSLRVHELSPVVWVAWFLVGWPFRRAVHSWTRARRRAAEARWNSGPAGA